jgi:hypothetical protein
VIAFQSRENLLEAGLTHVEIPLVIIPSNGKTPTTLTDIVELQDILMHEEKQAYCDSLLKS